MARARSKAAEAEPTPVPAKLQRFTLTDWQDLSERPPADWAFGELLYRTVRAHARYAECRREWAAAHGMTLRAMATK